MDAETFRVTFSVSVNDGTQDFTYRTEFDTCGDSLPFRVGSQLLPALSVLEYFSTDIQWRQILSDISDSCEDAIKHA